MVLPESRTSLKIAGHKLYKRNSILSPDEHLNEQQNSFHPISFVPKAAAGRWII